MRRQELVGICVWVLFAFPAVADISPPVWANHSSVTTLLEVAEPFPEYAVFRVSTYRTVPPGVDYRKSSGTVITWHYTAEEVAVDPAQPARITGDHSRRYSLYAVPRSAVEPGRQPKDLIEAVAQGKVPGAARLTLDDLEPWDAPRNQAELVVRYRLERTPDGVTFTRMTAHGTTTFDENSTGRRVRPLLAGVLAALALVALGVWWVRRGKRKPAGPSETPAG